MKNSNNNSDTLTFATADTVSETPETTQKHETPKIEEDDFVRKLSEISLLSTIMAEQLRAEYNSQTAALPRVSETQSLPRVSETQSLPSMSATQSLHGYRVPDELAGMYKSLAALSRIVEETADPSYGTRIIPEDVLSEVSDAGGELSRAKAAAAAGVLYRLFLDTEDSDRICEYFFSVSHYVAAEFFRLYFDNLPQGLRAALRDSLFAYTEIALDSGLQRELDLYFPGYPASFGEVSDTARTVFAAADTSVLKDELTARTAEFDAQLSELCEQNAQLQKQERQLRRTLKQSQSQTQAERGAVKKEPEILEKERRSHDATRDKLEKERERREKAEARYQQIKEMMVDADLSSGNELLTLKKDIASGLSGVAKDYAANKGAECNPTNYKAILNSIEQVFRVLKRFGIVFDNDRGGKKSKKKSSQNTAPEGNFDSGIDSIRIDDL